VKTVIARFPLAIFFVLWSGTLIVFTLVTAGGSFTPQVMPRVISWLDSVGPLATAAAALAALLCAWAISDPVRRPARPALRAVIALAVAIASVVLMVAQALLLSRSFVGVLPPLSNPSKLATAVLKSGDLPSTAQQVRSVITEPVTWLRAMPAGIVLSGLISPSSAVRRIAGAVVAWRPRGVLLRGMLALLLGALPAAVAVIGIRNAATMGTGHFVYRGSLSYGAIHFLCQLLLGVSLAFAWYGFVAERLRRWMPPLAIALVIGLATSAPSLAVRQIVSFHVGFTESYSVSPVLLVAAGTGMAFVAVWLTQTASASLLPALLFLAAESAAAYVVSFWFSASDTTWSWACVVLGGVVAVAGRMWRREPTDRNPAPVEVAAAIAQDYEVVVKDLGMPGDWPAGQVQGPDSP